MPIRHCGSEVVLVLIMPPGNNSSEDVRLEGGASDAEGRVLVRRNGQWGSICDDLWGLEDARVICRMLCYK